MGEVFQRQEVLIHYDEQFERKGQEQDSRSAEKYQQRYDRALQGKGRQEERKSYGDWRSELR